MRRPDYLRTRPRRGRWFHYYRRDGREISLNVHGLHPTYPRVFAAYCAEHARWESAPPDATKPKDGTFAWAVDLHKASADWSRLAPSTQQNRDAILRRYLKAQGDRPLTSITTADIEAALYVKGGNAAVNELKALKPVFAYARKLRIIPTDPTRGIVMERPSSKGFPTASADDIEKFQKRWPVGTTERQVFDLALNTGAARADLVKLGRHNIHKNVLTFHRQKTGVKVTFRCQPNCAPLLQSLPTYRPLSSSPRKAKRLQPPGLATCLAMQLEKQG